MCRSTSRNSGNSRDLRGRYTRQETSTPSPRPGGESPAASTGGLSACAQAPSLRPRAVSPGPSRSLTSAADGPAPSRGRAGHGPARADPRGLSGRPGQHQGRRVLRGSRTPAHLLESRRHRDQRTHSRERAAGVKVSPSRSSARCSGGRSACLCLLTAPSREQPWVRMFHSTAGSSGPPEARRSTRNSSTRAGRATFSVACNGT
jgi:hypothetical protein